MSLIVQAAAVTNPASTGDAFDLTDLTTVKNELADLIKDTSQDTLLQTLIHQASGVIQRYCDRIFAQQTYVETLAGYGNVYLTLHETPVIGVPTVLYQGIPITDFSVEDPDAGMLYRQNLWTYTGQIGWVLTGFVIPGGEQVDATGAYQVTYTAGWILPTQPSPPVPANQGGVLMPTDIQKACVDLVKWWWMRRKIDPEQAERREEQSIVRYREPGPEEPAELPRHVRWLLKPFKKLRL